MEAEIDAVLASGVEPVEWAERMPHVRAAFEESMRLYPPAPSINREAIGDDEWTSPEGERVVIPKGNTVLVMPRTLHRHELYWRSPRPSCPSASCRGRANAIARFQYLSLRRRPARLHRATFALQEAVIALAC